MRNNYTDRLTFFDLSLQQEYKLRSSSFFKFIHPSITSSFLNLNNNLSRLFLTASIYVPSLWRQRGQFHIHEDLNNRQHNGWLHFNVYVFR
jgi:hypothetical protein